MTFGEKIRLLLDERGQKSNALAKSLGTTGSVISTWLARGTAPAYHHLPGIKDFFGVDLNWLLDDRLGWEDRPRPDSDAEIAKVRRIVREADDASILRIVIAGIHAGNGQTPR